MYKSIQELKGQNGQPFKDIVKVRQFSLREKSNGSGKFGMATIQDTALEQFECRIWDEELSILLLEEYNKGPLYLHISGNTNIYNDNFQLVLTQAKRVTDIDPMLFLTSDYNGEEEWQTVLNILKGAVSEKGIETMRQLFLVEPTLFERFKQEFSARFHHDSVLHGLIAHTRKMIQIGLVIEAQQPSLFDTQDKIDLFYIGLLFHDIGKVKEYNLGDATDISFVSHRYLGTELIAKRKEWLIEQYSEDWYYHFVAILLQHHGEYEERPKTPFALLIHYIDGFETQCQTLTENMKKNEADKTFRMNCGSYSTYITKPTF